MRGSAFNFPPTPAPILGCDAFPKCFDEAGALGISYSDEKLGNSPATPACPNCHFASFLILLCVLGCAERPGDSGAEASDLDIVLSEVIPTVATVSWTAADSSGFVMFSPDGQAWQRIAAEARGTDSWEAVVVGMHQNASYKLRVGGLRDGSEIIYEPVEIETGGGPPDLPVLSAELDTVTADGGLLGLGLAGGTNWGVFVDADGFVDWWYPSPYESRHITRVVPSRDRRSVYLDVARSVEADASADFAILQVAWDGTLLQTIKTSVLHHDFLELPTGQLVWLGSDRREMAAGMVTGDTIQIRELSGEERVLWNAWTEFDFHDFAPDTDFVHANALQYDEHSGTLWLGLRNANQLLEIDPLSGDVLTRVFGADADITVTVGTPPDGQHNFTVLPTGWLIHDNRRSGELPSRLVEYKRVGDPPSAEQVWEYAPAEAYDGPGLGDALRLPGGDTLAIWGCAGVIDRVAPDATLTSRFAASLGTLFWYGLWTDDLQPLPPSE